MRPSTHSLQAICLLTLLLGACAGPEPRRFPPSWSQQRTDQPSGGRQRWYDLSGPGNNDYAEVLGTDGRIESIIFRDPQSGREDRVRLAEIPEGERLELVILLDSVPFEIVDELRGHGRFRLFFPPSRVIAPFPVMTDLSFAEFFGVSPSPGIEARRYNGQQLVGGTRAYVNLENSKWVEQVDYHLDFANHGWAYLWPGHWFDHELRRIGELRSESRKHAIIGYCVGTSAYGAKYGRNGHLEALIRLDRFCQALIHDSRGRIRITLLSDHGHDLLPSKRVPLRERLVDFGYRVVDELNGPQDVIVPEFGMVSCAALHTRSPERVAADSLGLTGVELVAYQDADDAVVVLSRTGRATIRRNGDQLEYLTQWGDPLRLSDLLAATDSDDGRARLARFDTATWFEKTCGGEFPDAVNRLWRAFHGLVDQPPSVLLSLEDGYFCGSADLAGFYQMSAAHGNLRSRSSFAFAMTMAGPLPDYLGMKQLRMELTRVGVEMDPAAAIASWPRAAGSFPIGFARQN